MFAARETYYFQIILGSGSSIYVDFLPGLKFTGTH